MIGTNIRGFRHLIRMAKASQEIKIIFSHDHNYINSGIALYVDGNKNKNPYTSSNNDYLLIFNDCTSNIKFNMDMHRGAENSDKISELSAKYHSVWLITVGKRSYIEDSRNLSHIIALPSNFDEEYDKFCTANKKQMPNATRFIEINHAILKYLFAITNASKNFFFWAVNARFKQGISFAFLEKVMIWNDNYSQLASKLSKGTITAYTNGSDFCKLSREMAKLRRDKRANDVINMFNTAQKKALRGVSLSDRDYDTLSKFGKLSGKKKSNFIRKMSTIEDASEILKQMSFLADVHFEWKKESVLDFIKNSEGFNCDVVINRGDILLLKVHDYDTVKRLAKTTNWCISKDKKYWIQYVDGVDDATQYVLMDFSLKEDDDLSIVGFTSVHDRGITNAHDFQNKNLMNGRHMNMLTEIRSFANRNADCRSIFGVLDKYGIKLSEVVSYAPNQYKWNRESMFEYLNRCVNEEDYYIVYDDGNRVCLIVENDNVMYFFGDTYIDRNDGVSGHGNQYIIFADFSKSEKDPEKLVFGIITYNYDERESNCGRLYNDRYEAIGQSFDSKLEEYGLPYDIICRKDNPVNRFFAAFSSLEVATAKDLLKNDKVAEVLKKREKASTIRDLISHVTFTYNSPDYIDMFYDCGYKLSDIIGGKSACDIVRRILNSMFDLAHTFRLDGRTYLPTQENIDALNHNEIYNNNEAIYVGYFTIIDRIIDEEANNYDFMHRLSNYVYERHVVTDLFDHIAIKILNSVSNDNSNFAIFNYVVSYAYNYHSARVIVELSKKAKENKVIDSLIGKFTKTSTSDYITVSMQPTTADGNAYYAANVVAEERG